MYYKVSSTMSLCDDNNKLTVYTRSQNCEHRHSQRASGAVDGEWKSFRRCDSHGNALSTEDAYAAQVQCSYPDVEARRLLERVCKLQVHFYAQQSWVPAQVQVPIPPNVKHILVDVYLRPSASGYTHSQNDRKSIMMRPQSQSLCKTVSTTIEYHEKDKSSSFEVDLSRCDQLTVKQAYDKRLRLLSDSTKREDRLIPYKVYALNISFPSETYWIKGRLDEPFPDGVASAKLDVYLNPGCIIGITGPSRCGKGWASQVMLKQLVSMGYSARIVGQDDFWTRGVHVKVKGELRYSEEEPVSTDHLKFACIIQEAMTTNDFVIAEGFQLVYSEKVSKQLGWIFQLDIHKKDARDRRTRAVDGKLNPNPLSVLDFDDLLWPSYQRYLQNNIAPLRARVHKLKAPNTVKEMDTCVRRMLNIVSSTRAPAYTSPVC
jgi:hypothetical protein